MKKVLIPARYKIVDDILRGYANAEIGNFLLQKGLLPIMPFVDTEVSQLDDAMEIAKKYITDADGIILQGGNDIDPQFYKQKAAGAEDPIIYRDLFEISLVKLALSKKIPVLGICRGMQLINVAYGGTLIQDIDTKKYLTHMGFSQTKPVTVLDIEHEVELQPNSFLRNYFGKDKIMVNSYHHQAVDDVGKGLTIEACATDGIIESISDIDQKVLGVQWHPEIDFKNKEYRKIFDIFLSWIDKSS